VVHLRQLHETYGNRVQFLLVYILEGGHALPEGLKEFEIDSRAPFDVHRNAPRCARAGMELFHLEFPCLLDSEADEVMGLYRAHPKRMLLIDTDGRIAVDSGPVPDEPFPWKKITTWLDSHPSSKQPSLGKQEHAS
jgi:hypothetical protein